MTMHSEDWRGLARIFMPIVYKLFGIGRDRGPQRQDERERRGKKDRNQGR